MERSLMEMIEDEFNAAEERMLRKVKRNKKDRERRKSEKHKRRPVSEPVLEPL